MRRRLAVLAAVAWVATASCAFAAITRTGSVGPYRAPLNDGAGRGVAVLENGDVVLAGTLSNACGGITGAYVSRMDRTLTNRSWEFYFTPNNSCMDTQVRGVVASGNLTIVFGRNSTNGGFLTVLTKEGAMAWHQMEFALDEGIFDAAIDPVDGTLWAVGNSTTPTSTGRLLHFRVAGNVLTDRTDLPFNWGGNQDSHAYAVAVTADSVYIGGRCYDIAEPSQKSWLVRKPRGSATAMWQKRGRETGGESAVWSLAARGDRLFSEYMTGTGAGPYSFSMVRHNASTGDFEQSTPLVNANAPVSFDLRGQLAMHPSLPLLAYGGSNGVKVVDFALSNISSVFPVALGNVFNVDGVAFDAGMNFNLYTAHSVMNAAPNYMEVAGFAFSDPDRKEEKQFIVAPNVLVLSEALGSIRLDAVKLEPGDAVTFTVFDAAGHKLTSKKVVANSGGEAQWLWDGTLEDGKQRINPGGYIVRADKGTTLIGRSNFIAVKKRGSK